MKYIIDPVHGFLTIPDGIIAAIVRHPAFQRLTRIRQLGAEGMVYPGAQHTRFQHSLGAYHLTRLAAVALESKGVEITREERDGLYAAILLHDTGHGPFSHALEDAVTRGASHEFISEAIMRRINEESGGRLDCAIRIFNGSYERHFLHELVSSQLDMDRLDYLCRDSFFTGVREGNVGAERIIQMLDVRGDSIVVSEKGVYSVENYLMTRRMMYWQVYRHKTVVAAEIMLVNILERARELMKSGMRLPVTPALEYFLSCGRGRESFAASGECLDMFLKLDDNDIMSAVKSWTDSGDSILATLSEGFVNRRLFKVEIFGNAVPAERAESVKAGIARRLGLGEDEARYYIGTKTVQKDMYSLQSDQIKILMRNGEIKTMPQVSEIIRGDTAALPFQKAYLAYARV